MFKKRRFCVISMGIFLAVLAAGCKKKAPPPPPPPPAPKPVEPKVEAPKAPVINLFTADPSSIERGQASTLRWEVANATDVSIDQGVGPVQARGTRQVFPSSTTTYRLVARGAGGTADATATVTVAAPPPPPPPPPKVTEDLPTRVGALQDAYFDYDKSDIREDARAALTKDAESLKAIFADFPNATIVIEGHCDERGSAEYNLGLGDRRATAAKDFLTQLGVPGDKLKTISYGKERPVCTEHEESCWQRNRRAHFSTGQ